MTETERQVNATCERLMAGGRVRLYRDLYKDLREHLPCVVVCRLICGGLDRTRRMPVLAGVPMAWHPIGERARAIAALKRLERYARLKTIGLTSGRECWIGSDL